MNTNTLTVALALSESGSMNDDHFGAAARYAIFRCNQDSCEHVLDIPNESVEERFESDPLKVKSVRELLKPHKVSVVVSPRFGPNILKMKLRLTTVIVRTYSKEIALSWLQRNWLAILERGKSEGAKDTIVLDDAVSDELDVSQYFPSSRIDYNICQNCGKCVKKSGCPSGSIAFSEEGIVEINPDTCVGCGLCAVVCPFGAITVVATNLTTLN